MDDAQREDVIRNREVQRADVAPQYHSQPVLDHKSHVLEIESLIRQSIKKIRVFCLLEARGRAGKSFGQAYSSEYASREASLRARCKLLVKKL